MTTIHGWQNASRRAMVPVRTLRRLVAEGHLKATKLSGATWEFDDCDLVATALAHASLAVPTGTISPWLLDAAAARDGGDDESHGAGEIVWAATDEPETLEPFGSLSTWLSNVAAAAPPPPMLGLVQLDVQRSAAAVPQQSTTAEVDYWRAMFRATRIKLLGDMVATEAMDMGASPRSAQVAADAAMHALDHLSAEQLIYDSLALPIARGNGHSVGVDWDAWRSD